jgi:spore germination cell wall hydrolase CwlJ-like protein
MKAVENFFDKRHNVFIKFGSIIALIFLTIYVPAQSHANYQVQIEQHKQTIEVLEEKLEEKNEEIMVKEKQVKLLTKSFEKQAYTMQQVECLAKNIYFEAGAESTAGKIAVAEVTMNRVKHKQFPKTVCGVVYQKSGRTCQFSWVCQGKSKAPASPAWNESKQIAKNILIGKRDYNVVGNALFFHATSIYPKWAGAKRLVARIGNHIFYH